MDEINICVDFIFLYISSFLIVFLMEIVGMVVFLIVVLFFVVLDVRKIGYLSYFMVRLVLFGIIIFGIVVILELMF